MFFTRRASPCMPSMPAAVAGNKVIVQTLPDKTKFVTLDGVERELSSSDLMICNENEGMCIAGVFGGLQVGSN
ncbi:MAG: phenylalanine--tRNA ligase beta subunit-related protein [Marinilabiliales bacterium]|nr:phenylalanine--tRNA ligase beta subunit-related protein [Marinilabiliales bacterium]